MPSLACCFVDDETPFCDHRRFETLPMCKKHMHETMRRAVLDSLMPWDVMSEIVKLTAQWVKIHEFAERSERKAAEEERQARLRAASQQKRRQLGVVYYLRLSGNRIKIGRTIDLKTRMSAMRIPRHDVLAAEPGGHGVESDRHHEFRDIRHGRLEDFDATPELLDHIQSIRAQWGDPWALDAA